MLLGQIKYVTNCPTMNIPFVISVLTTIIFQGIKIILPIFLIIKETINLGKIGDENNKNNNEIVIAKQKFTKTLLTSALIFLALTFIQFGINMFSESTSSNDIWICIQDLINF